MTGLTALSPLALFRGPTKQFRRATVARSLAYVDRERRALNTF